MGPTKGEWRALWCWLLVVIGFMPPVILWVEGVQIKVLGMPFLLVWVAGMVLMTSVLMTLAYWNRDFLAQPRLLNAQNGEYLAVEVADEGLERIEVGGQQVASNRYRVRNRERGVDITVWYARDNGDWLSLESRVEGGRVIRYLPVSLNDSGSSSPQAAIEINARSGTRQ